MKPLSQRNTFGEILELTSDNPTPDEIKTNYRRLVKQYHPDVNKDPEAIQYIKKLNWAYGVATGKIQVNQRPQVHQQTPHVVVVVQTGSWSSGFSYTVRLDNW